MWKVSKSYLCGYSDYIYQVYKIENRKILYNGRIYLTREAAQARADELNKIKNSLHSCCITVQASKPRLTKHHTISIAS